MGIATRILILAGALLVGSIGVAFAQDEPTELRRAIADADIQTLRRLRDEAMDSPERQLAVGAIAAFTNDNANAASALGAAMASSDLSDDLRAQAASALAGVFLREGRFAAAVESMEVERQLQGGALDEPGAARSLALAQALSPIDPLGVTAPERGETDIRRDRARLPRADVVVNGHAAEAVLDTGASYSTIMESVARDLGVRLRPGAVAVGSATGEVQARLGVADQIEFAGVRYTNVPFLVLPDDALTFAGGLYRIPMIVGLPLLIELGRLQFGFERRRGVLRYTRGSHRANDESNLVLNGLQPLVLVRANGENLRLLLDTGARSTFLSRAVLTEAPALVADAERRAATMIGAGGASRDADALRVESLNIDVLDRAVSLSGVTVVGEPRAGTHGVLGQDVLLSGAGYVIDFEAMRVEIMP